MKLQPKNIKENTNWLTRPTAGHLVQFYSSANYLLSPLGEFIDSGLRNGEICIVIATPKHIAALRDHLEDGGIDSSDAVRKGNLITLDAADTLTKFMVEDMPDRKKFFDHIGGLIEKSTVAGRPVRAYGEMVALLWESGNKAAVITLENLWNELIEKYSFSLYCAYPELHFVLDRGAINDIRHTHDVHYPLSTVG